MNRSTEARPLIAVTTSEVRRSESVALTPQGEPPRHEMALGLRYLQALESAGAIPMVIPPLSPPLVDALLDRVDGICLSGGPDLDPVAYHERRHEQTGPVERHLDTFELALAAEADARKLPMLAICRGLQVLNVSRGGSLHQHLPDLEAHRQAGHGAGQAPGEPINHRQPEPGEQTTHSVRLSDSSRLAGILGTTELEVNSFHHQAVDRLGSDLIVTGHAPDGSVESLEATDRDFLVGVQWHAETLTHLPEQLGLFQAFVDVAGSRRSGSRHLRVA